METFADQLLEIGFLKLAVALTANESTTENIDHTNRAIIHVFRCIEIKIKLGCVSFSLEISFHVLRKGAYACEENC